MTFFIITFLLLEQIVDVRNWLVIADGFNALGQQESNRENLQIRSVLNPFFRMLDRIGNDEFLNVTGSDPFQSVMGEYSVSSGTVDLSGTVFLQNVDTADQ